MRVNIEGECTVARADELRAHLVEMMVPNETIELNLDKVTSLDLSFCQLLHALRQTCAEKGVELKLSGNLPPEHAELAGLCGLPEMAGDTEQA